MARVFKPTYPKMRTVKGPDGQAVMVERVATKGKHKGQRIMAPRREPVVGLDGKPVLVASRKWYVEYRWLPAVNAVRSRYAYDEWDFIEVANDIRDIKNQLFDKIRSL